MAIATVKAILAEEGWDSVTHVRVAERSGLARATLYVHWPDKSALLRAALTDVVMEARAPFVGILATDLLAVLDAIRYEFTEGGHARVLTVLLDRSESEPEFEELKAEIAGAYSALVREVLLSAVNRGELRTDLDLDRAVAELIGPLLWQRFLSGESLTREFVAAVIEDFVAGHRSATKPRSNGARLR
jgi:AcrR family transcriptional regulator